MNCLLRNEAIEILVMAARLLNREDAGYAKFREEFPRVTSRTSRLRG